MPAELVYGVAMLVVAAIILTFAAVTAGETVWMERRVAGRIQARIGPNRVGPQGLLQFLADALKLIGKEDAVPSLAARGPFLLAPIIVFIGAFAPFAVIPFGHAIVAADMNIGVLLVLAISSLEVVGIILAGWASNSKWAVLGAMREIAQMISYEIPLAIAALTIVVLGGSMNLTTLVEQQSGGFWNWYILRGPFSFIAFFIFGAAMLAELKRAPFDLPEAESELVAGFFTEYTGFRFAVFFLGEYAAMILMGMLASILFLGGWDPGIGLTLDGTWTRWLGVLVLLTKAMLLVFVMMWLRWSLPRMRIDRVMYLCYKVLLPWSIVCVLGVAVQMLVGHALSSPWLMGM
jgi:NADH-quinone oxidoreductase subunit H